MAPYGKKEDILETGTEGRTNERTARGTSNTIRTVVPDNTAVPRPFPQNEVIRTTPAVLYNKQSWRLKFPRAWRSLHI